jgi:hypothetical protein
MIYSQLLDAQSSSTKDSGRAGTSQRAHRWESAYTHLSERFAASFATSTMPKLHLLPEASDEEESISPEKRGAISYVISEGRKAVVGGKTRNRPAKFSSVGVKNTKSEERLV